MIKILKGQKIHIDKEQGKTKHEAPHSVNYRATQNKNNIGTAALERSVVYTTGGGGGGAERGFKLLSLRFVNVLIANVFLFVFFLFVF